MELLEYFQFTLDDQFFGKKIVSGATKMYSVNGAYTTNKFGTTSKSSNTVSFQERLKNIILYSKKNKGIYKGHVFLNIEINKIVSKKKNGEIDERGLIDIDNTLKGSIDCLSKTVIADDDQVMGMLVKLFYNKSQHSYIRIKVYKYDEQEFDSFKLNWKRNNLENIVYENYITLPNGMHCISYNEMYDRTYRVPKLKTEAKNYKTFLSNLHSKKYGGQKINEDVLIGDYVFHFNFGDLDNKVKAFQDSLTNYVIKNDNQFQTLFLQKKPIKTNQESINVTLYKKIENV